eukprot:gene8273-98_t
MGVPYFFSWLVKQCPNIITKYTEDIFVDNFYLDMNHIFHQFKNIKSEEEMFLQIFLYIEELVNIVKPKKYLFFAIDGVCPRTKLNQQRQRRWSIHELSEENIDSKSITPGTDFMTKLSNHLQYFIRRKIQDDKNWKNIQNGVFFSDSNSAGEGEHKIIDFMKQKNLKETKMKHCIYGMDSDLIMIGLATHEEDLILLRENSKKKNSFEFLSLNILRQYIDFAFSNSFSNSSIQYKLERIIDDFILMLYLCGNDFLPSIPTLDIGNGALDDFFRIYKELIQNDDLKEYVVDSENEKINIDQLKIFIKELAKGEEESLKKSLKKMNFFKPKEELEIIEKEKPIENEEEEVFEKSTINSKFINLFPFIEFEKCELLNATGDLTSILSQPMDLSEDYIESKVDDQILINIQFGFTVKLNSLTLFGSNEKSSPKKIKIYINDVNINFSDVSNFKEIQEFELTNSTQEIRLKFVKLQKVNSLTIFIESNQNNEKKTFISHLGLFGIPNINEISSNKTLTKVPRRRYFKMKKKNKKLRIDQNKSTKESKNEMNILSKSTKLIDSKIYLDFDLWKENYYKIKMNLDYQKKSDRIILLEHYIDGLLWNFKYYYSGCPSWDWYFPFYYSPLLSDFEILEEYNPKNFILGAPVKPIEQLLSVLPPRSSYLLPKEFRDFFKHEKLEQYYPKEDIKVDSEFMKWEPVKILPFIDMNILQTVLKDQVENYFKYDNSNQLFQFLWNEEEVYYYKSTLNRLPDIDECKVACLIHLQ